MKVWLLLLCSMAAATPGFAGAHPGEETAPATSPAATELPAATAAPASPAPVSSTDEAAVRAVVDDFHRALLEGYRDGVLKLLDERAVIFETGFVEVDREQYATGHLDSDLMFAAQVRREVVHSEATVAGDMAIVLTQSRSAGEFMGAKIHLENTETMVLRRGADGWKIVHIHWSGHDRTADNPDTNESQ